MTERFIEIERRFNYFVEEITSSEEAAAVLTLATVIAEGGVARLRKDFDPDPEETAA